MLLRRGCSLGYALDLAVNGGFSIIQALLSIEDHTCMEPKIAIHWSRPWSISQRSCGRSVQLPWPIEYRGRWRTTCCVRPDLMKIRSPSSSMLNPVTSRLLAMESPVGLHHCLRTRQVSTRSKVLDGTPALFRIWRMRPALACHHVM